MGTAPQPEVTKTEPLYRAALTTAGAQAPSAESALIQGQAPATELRKLEDKCALLRGVPIEVDVAIPIRRFQVRNVLALAAGQVIASRWLEGEDVPLAAHGEQLAWTEIEVIDQKLAVRITRLA